ncbi:DUF397 domain-containing protein [Streptomyces sp. MS19]|uniref:DUF397 domain-containing protein n=1 Tax=Streptomyces sp. MS19 TaxID=3385972 RepID=UPI0039A30930
MVERQQPVWRKSSYSSNNGGNCVEVAEGVPGVVPVRDSKVVQGPVLAFPVETWRAFVGAGCADPSV